jgi:hypothetical protein
MSSAELGPAPTEAANYYGLLYVDRTHDRHVNLRTSRDPVAVYVGCASLLAASAREAGESFAVLTNAADELREIARTHGFPAFECREIAFDLDLPRGTRFFQAHYKLCVLEAMGSGDLGAFTALVDIDAVLLAPLSRRLNPNRGLQVFGMDERLAGGQASDIERLIGPDRRPRQWYGGEFIAGDWDSMRRLAAKCRTLLPRYLEALPELTHVGDETIVSAAINLLVEEGAPVHDLGRERLVARWYSSRLPVLQEPLAQALEAVVLHLPNDKVFLQDRARRPFSAAAFRRDLVRHALGKSILRQAANPLLSLAQGQQKFAPRVWGARPLNRPWPPPIRQEWR